MATGWHYYKHVIVDTHETGYLQVAPAAADGIASEIIKQHAIVTKREVRWVAAFQAASAADFPDLPAAETFVKSATLLHSEKGSESAIYIGTNCYLYAFWGKYLYALTSATGVDAAFPVGGLPQAIDNLGPNVRYFPAAKFQAFLDTGNFTPPPPSRPTSSLVPQVVVVETAASSGTNPQYGLPNNPGAVN